MKLIYRLGTTDLSVR